MSRGDLIYDILRQVRPLTLASAKAIEADLRAHRLTIGMRAVLEILNQSDPTTVPRLAERLGLSRQAVQRVVDDLLDRTYVAASANPAHRRSLLIGITPAGIAAFAALRARETARLHTLLDDIHDIDDADLRTAARVLAALHRDVRARIRPANDNNDDNDNHGGDSGRPVLEGSTRARS